jgi:hypothetical protein
LFTNFILKGKRVQFQLAAALKKKVSNSFNVMNILVNLKATLEEIKQVVRKKSMDSASFSALLDYRKLK